MGEACPTTRSRFSRESLSPWSILLFASLFVNTAATAHLCRIAVPSLALAPPAKSYAASPRVICDRDFRLRDHVIASSF